MALVSVGYGGTVDYPDYGKGVVSGSRYTVEGSGAWAPTRVTSGADRTVRIAAGTGMGYGIRDTETSSTDLQLDTVASGSRWDLVVAHRDWSTGTTDFRAVNGGSSKAIPGRDTNPGISDDHPITLARVTAGEQYPTALVDLRCWSGDGGLIAVDTLALDYLAVPGTRVSIGASEYTRVLSASGTGSWDLKEPPADTEWVGSSIPNQDFSGTRRYRIADGQGWFQATGNRTGGILRADDRTLLHFSQQYAPSEICYGVTYVAGGYNLFRAYILPDGWVHMGPVDMDSGDAFQVYITWPIG